MKTKFKGSLGKPIFVQCTLVDLMEILDNLTLDKQIVEGNARR